MEVFFSCSTDNILEHKDSYIAILKTIKSEGHVLTRDWLEKSLDLAEKKREDIPREKLYTEVMSAIIAADVAIFDCTVQSMSIGHQLTFALDKGKPTLLVAQKSQEKIEGLFISGSKSSYLTLRNYSNNEDLKQAILEFLSKNSSKAKVRFQIVLDRAQHDFIEWASFRYKRNKSDIIKDAIDDKSSNNEEYQKFLSN